MSASQQVSSPIGVVPVPAAGSSGAVFRPIRSVAVVIDDGVAPFEFATACEVFAVDRTDAGLPAFDFAVCSPRPGPVRTSAGFEVIAPHRLDALAGADLVVVPALGLGYQPGPELVAALHGAVATGATVISLCTGAFVLARAGLLDGRRATSHWSHTDELAALFPAVDVVPDVLFVEDGPIATSAGTAAGIDLCLHLVRRSYGSVAANCIARRMVVPPQRDGGQAQFVQSPLRPVEVATLAPVLDWVLAHLDDDLSVALLARRAGMSERTFARRFRDETGTTPHQWLLAQRIALAERLLEEGDLPIEAVAHRCGFASAEMLRHHFRRLRSTAPRDYRRTFGHRPGHTAGTGVVSA
jgi:AraC family transcriptional activator FtrA